MKSNFVLSPNFYGSFTALKNEKDPFGVFLNDNQEITDFRWSGLFSNMDLSITNPTKTALVKLYLYQGCGHESSKELLTRLFTEYFVQ